MTRRKLGTGLYPADTAPTTPEKPSHCPCGHVWHAHDVDEYSGDGSEMCCVHGCEQSGCPGRQRSRT
jgi:hypothetical protein